MQPKSLSLVYKKVNYSSVPIILAIFLVSVVVFLFLSNIKKTEAQSFEKCTFTRDLSIGTEGEDVRCLQKFLNKEGYQISSSGPGSFGNETNRFGSLTADALKRWQKASAVSQTGIWGPLSRSRYDEMFARIVSTNSGSSNLGQNVSSVVTPTVIPSSIVSTPSVSADESKARALIKKAKKEIDDARDEVEDVDDDGDDIGDAEDLLDDAEESLIDALYSFIDGDYRDASAEAQDAIDFVDDALEEGDLDDRDSDDEDYDEGDAEDAIEDAENAIDDAEEKIEEADDDGEDVDEAEELLDEAKDLLDEAEEAFDDEDWDEAVELAEEAMELAEEAEDEI